MRDIRVDLRERVVKIETEERKTQEHLDFLSRQKQSVMALIEQENALWPSAQDNLFEKAADSGSAKERTGLGSLLIRALADNRPKSLRELKQIAKGQGFDFAGKQPGRVIHFALLGMAQNGQVEMLAKGIWKKKDSVTQGLNIKPESKVNGAVNGSSGPKHVIEEFIRHHGPVSRQEIMRGSGAAEGSVSYSLKDSRFRQLPDGKWDLVTDVG